MYTKPQLYSEHELEMHKKIEQLREMVYPKKRKPVLKTKSYQSLPIKKFTTKAHEIVIIKKKGDRNSIQKQPDSPTTPLKKTNLQFMDKKSPGEKKSTWTVQNWMPVNNNTELLKRKYLDPKEEYYEETHTARDRFVSLEDKCVPKFEQRDPQSLLRKNSLFLLNFIRTRQKKHFHKIQEQFPVISAQIKQREQIKPLKRHERQKIYLESIKTIKNEEKTEKVTNLLQNPIYPEPW